MNIPIFNKQTTCENCHQSTLCYEMNFHCGDMDVCKPCYKLIFMKDYYNGKMQEKLQNLTQTYENTMKEMHELKMRFNMYKQIDESDTAPA